MIRPAHTACIAITLLLGPHLAMASESACRTVSTRMLDHLDSADFSAARDDFDQRMKTALSADKLAALWHSLAQKFGSKGPRGTVTITTAGAYDVVITPLHYGSGLIDAQVACDTAGSIAGFYIKPHR